MAPGLTLRIGGVSPRLAVLGALEACSGAAAPGRDACSSSPAARAGAARQCGAARSLPLGGRSDPVTTGYPYSYNTYSALPDAWAEFLQMLRSRPRVFEGPNINQCIAGDCGANMAKR
jgi:hypothetical protein